MFKHELGVKAVARVSRLTGIITARSENLFGCNRYYIQPQAVKEMKVPDGFWVDEDDVEVTGKGVTVARKDTGGPMSRVV